MLVAKVDGSIDRTLASYLAGAVEEAERTGATLVLQLDSAGTLDQDAVALAERIHDASVPVIVWVGPAPAKAAGAGLLFLYAASLGAVAPGAGVGPLEPLDLSGDEPLVSEREVEALRTGRPCDRAQRQRPQGPGLRDWPRTGRRVQSHRRIPLVADLRHALRLLVKQPGLTIPVVLALALGIGVNTTIFGFVDGLLFRPLPVERLDEVVRVTAIDRERPDDHSNSSYPVFTDYRDGAKSFAALAAYSDDNAVHMSVGAGAPERLTGALVSGRFFEVLGTRAWRGRLLGPDDDRVAGHHPVAVISYGLWRRVFGGSDEHSTPSRVARSRRRTCTERQRGPDGRPAQARRLSQGECRSHPIGRRIGPP